MGLLPEEGLDLSADQRHASRASDEDHLINVVRGEAGIFQGETAGPERALHQFHGEGFKLIAGEIFRVPAFAFRQVEDGRGLQLIGESDFCPLGFQSDRLHLVGIGIHVEAMLLADFLDEQICELAVEVIASEMGVAVGCQDLKDAVLELEDGNIEGSSAKVVDGDCSLSLLLESIGQRGGGRFIDNS